MKREVMFIVGAMFVLAGALALFLILTRSKVSQTSGGGLAVRFDGFSGYTNRLAPNDTAVFRLTNVHPFAIEFVAYEHPTRVEVSRGTLRPHEVTNLFLSLSDVPSWLQINYEKWRLPPFRAPRYWASRLETAILEKKPKTPLFAPHSDYLLLSDEMRIPKNAKQNRATE